MTEISRAALFGKLNPIAYKAIEGATVFCKLRGNPTSSWCTGCTRSCRCRIPTCTGSSRHFELDPRQAVAADITAALDRLPRGATSISDLPPQIEEVVERGWVFATLMFGETQVRTGHLLIGVAEDARRCATRCSAISRAVRAGEGGRAGRRVCRHRARLARGGAAPPRRLAGAARRARRAGAMAPAAMGKQEALKRVLGRPDGAGAQRRDRPDRRPRRTRSARSSTS